jgi:hypothetical protein
MKPIPIYLNRELPDDERRRRLFEGAFFLFTGRKETRAIAEWAQSLVAEAFGPGVDANAHAAFAVDEFVARAGPLKSRFTNDAHTKALCQDFVKGMGADPERTYFDLPRLRVVPPQAYLSSGVSYNYQPHRDTWYAHPPQLINYWAPVLDVEVETVMSLFVDYFDKEVENASSRWDYDDWVKNQRFSAANNVGGEARPHPLPIENVSGTTDIRIVQNAGDIMAFSTCQLHASAPNTLDTTRFSFDLRTLNIDDLIGGRGPANLDGRATGSTLADFLRVSDLTPLDPAAFGLAGPVLTAA